ncbi:L,D-transpeptidase [Prosthecobacter sp.]|uniref:L,D-transpeptidase n=1 Tax=Prosthecobacter sp. TaxID=1965333 RepID=UPI003783AFDE
MNSHSTILRGSLKALAFAGLALALSNCATAKKSGNYSLNFDPPAKAVKNPANVRVKLSTGAQRVYVMEGNEVLLATPCSVGTASTPTPHGNFTIYHKEAHRRRASSPGAGYPMTFWMEFKSAYGMHWGWVKPVPCTHGCVRLPIKSAQKIFSMVRTGTPLNIAASQPEDATIGKTLPVLNDSSLADPPDSYMNSPKVFEDAAKGKMYY